VIHHHPADHHLIALAAGQLDSARGFVVATHVEACPACRHRIQDYLAVGGELLQAVEPLHVAPEAFARTLQRIDAVMPADAAAPAPGAAAPAGFPREALALLPPRLLQGCGGEPWRWIGPGVRYSEIWVPHAARSKVFLLKIAAGRTLPEHAHGGCEFTQVLSGSFADGRASFAGGDFDETDPQVTHQPVVADDDECICLAYLDSPLRFSGWIPRVAARWTGFRAGFEAASTP
jgi:putative transcriptional regulator